MEKESNLMNGYRTAYKIACDKFVTSDYSAIAINANAMYNATNDTITIMYLNRNYIVDCHTGNVTLSDDTDEVSTTVKVLILHYLLTARPRPLTGHLVTFREIPSGGSIYYPNFQKRAVNPLVKVFSKNHDGFLKAAELLGGTREKLGHVSVRVEVLPLIPVTMVLWQGDDEVPDSGNVLFDESVVSYLPVEDMVVAGSNAVYEMMAMLRKLG